MNFWILPLSLAILLISIFLFYKAAGSLSPSKMNLVSWVFYFQLVLQSFVGINLGALGVDHYTFAKSSQHHIFTAYLAVLYVLTVMPLSMVVVQKIFLGGGIRRKLMIYYERPLEPLQSSKDSVQIMFWVSMTIVSFLATVYVYYTIKSFPFLSLLAGSERAASLRQNASFGFTGNFYIRNFFSLLMSQWTSYIAFGYLLMNPSFSNKTWFSASLIISFFALTSSGEKAPLLFFMLGLFLVYGLSRKRLHARTLGIAGLSAVLLITLLYASIGQFKLRVNSGPVGRIVMSQVAGLPLHFKLFPEFHPFLHGASFPQWMTSLWNTESVRSGRIVMKYANPRGFATKEAGVMNTLFVGEAWANFGWFGFFLSPVLVGIVIQTSYNLFLSLPKSPLFVALMVYLTLRVPITGGFVDFIWNSGWIIIFLITVFSLRSRGILLDAKSSFIQGVK